MKVPASIEAASRFMGPLVYYSPSVLAFALFMILIVPTPKAFAARLGGAYYVDDAEMLALAPRPMQQRVLGRSLQAFTAKTIVDVDRVEEELTQTLKRGYAAAPEEAMLGINAVAAPVFDGSDSCVAAVAIVGSIQFLPEQPNVATLEALTACGREISRKLGHGRGTNFSTPELRSPQRKVS
jgi:hypothetical protein